MSVGPLRRSWRRLCGVWRRSLQLRVVVATLLISGGVVALLGVLMVEQIGRGMVEFHRSYAIEEVDDGREYAQRRLSQLTGPDDPAADSALGAVTANLSDRGQRARLFAVSVNMDNPRLPQRYVVGYKPDALTPPRQLARLIEKQNVLAYQYVSAALGGEKARPVLVVGAPVSTPAGEVHLYYFFHLDAQVESIALVRKATISTGVVLVLALGATAFGMTRMVVRPVSQAAHTAERLSAGVLTERMPVHGEDEVARLGRSFNQMAASLQRQITQLENYSSLQRRFTSDVSHELRTPLTTIRMATDVLHRARGEFPSTVARSAELLYDQVDHFEALLTDLLEISRYDSGAAVLEPEPTDVVQLVGGVRRSLAAVAERAGVVVELVAPDAPVVCEIDPRRVARIIRNLLNNAIEYGRVSGASEAGVGGDPGAGPPLVAAPILVTVASNSHAVAVTVRDHGIGLSAEECEAVFHRFWRSDPSRARHTGGTGLGLSIALEDARLHGGSLDAWGEPGRGAQFRLTLPVRAGGPLTPSPLPLVPADGSGSRRGSESAPSVVDAERAGEAYA